MREGFLFLSFGDEGHTVRVQAFDFEVSSLSIHPIWMKLNKRFPRLHLHPIIGFSATSSASQAIQLLRGLKMTAGGLIALESFFGHLHTGISAFAPRKPSAVLAAVLPGPCGACRMFEAMKGLRLLEKRPERRLGIIRAGLCWNYRLKGFDQFLGGAESQV
jgi:hypothetical protein